MTGQRRQSVGTPKQRRGRLASFFVGLTVGICVAVVTPSVAQGIDGTYKKLRVFSQVLAYVQQNYVDTIGEQELIYDSIVGMLSDLDPHSVFMRPEEYNKLKEDTAGEFGGLGLEIGQMADGGVVIETVFPDGAAERAGLRKGDRIVAVDGSATVKADVTEVAKQLRGLPGTRVTMRIDRKGWKKPRDIPLVRRHVRIPSVEHRPLDDGIGYLRIRTFQERTDQEVAEALNALKVLPGGRRQKLTGLVLDLRENPGGLLDEGVRVADRFLGAGLIVRTEGRDPRDAERQMAHRLGTEPRYPIVVLVNQGSASASEIVAGALQDHKRAKLVGTRSFGKGSVQTLFGLADGSGLKLTIARYFTPSGRSIAQRGVEPDVVVPDSPVGTDTDAPLEAAVRLLKKRR